MRAVWATCPVRGSSETRAKKTQSGKRSGEQSRGNALTHTRTHTYTLLRPLSTPINFFYASSTAEKASRWSLEMP